MADNANVANKTGDTNYGDFNFNQPHEIVRAEALGNNEYQLNMRLPVGISWDQVQSFLATGHQLVLVPPDAIERLGNTSAMSAGAGARNIGGGGTAGGGGGPY